MKEIWKDVKGYEGSYQVSSLGRVKLVGGKILEPKTNKKEYALYGLRKDGKSKNHGVHRLLAFAFLMPINCSNPNVLFKDKDKSNIALSNLYFRACYECRTKVEGVKYVRGSLRCSILRFEERALKCNETERVKIQELLTAIKEVIS